MRDIMEFIKKNKKYFVLGGAILLALIISIFIYLKFNNDGMNNKGVYNIKYRIYQNGKWSRYTKNGMTIGDKKNPIRNIQIKHNNDKGKILFDLYDTNTWYGFMEGYVNADEIDGVAFTLTDVLKKKYDICYRTYNNKDKWLNWSCNEEKNGNKNEPITAIEIKVIPKNSIKFDYLKNYNETLEQTKNF